MGEKEKEENIYIYISAAYNWFKTDEASLEDEKHISRPAVSRNNKTKAKV